jgi:hypothetical protein
LLIGLGSDEREIAAPQLIDPRDFRLAIACRGKQKGRAHGVARPFRVPGPNPGGGRSGTSAIPHPRAAEGKAVQLLEVCRNELCHFKHRDLILAEDHPELVVGHDVPLVAWIL